MKQDGQPVVSLTKGLTIVAAFLLDISALQERAVARIVPSESNSGIMPFPWTTIQQQVLDWTWLVRWDLLGIG